MLRSPALIAILVLCFGYAHQALSATNDVAEIYGSFLDNWTGKDKDPINVSITAEAPSTKDLEQFSDCANKGTKTRWMPTERIPDITNFVGKLSYVRLVDPDKWSPQDPGDLIAQGKSVDKAVESGFAHGLLTFSAIAFDESRGIAAFTYSFVCGGLCGNGGTAVFKRSAGGWVRSKVQCGGWISQIQRGRPNNSFKPTAEVRLVISNRCRAAAA